MLQPEVRQVRSGELTSAHQFTIEAASVTVELVIKAAAPQRSVGGTTVGALSLDTSGSGVRSGLVTGEARAGDVGRASILRLNTQGGPLARLGVDDGEGGEFVHGRSKRSKGGHIREGRGGGRSVGLLGLVGGNRLHVNILGLEVLVETSSRGPGARGFNGCEEFIKGQLDRWADNVKMVDIIQRKAFSEGDWIGTGWCWVIQGTRIEVIGEEGRETEGGGGLIVLVDNWFCGVRTFAATLG